MGEWIEELERLTEQFMQGLEEASEEEFTQFVDQREQWIEKMKQRTPSYHEIEQHRHRIDQLLKLDLIIASRMERLKDEAAIQVSKVSTANMQRNAYDAVYTPDGIYFDRKK